MKDKMNSVFLQKIIEGLMAHAKRSSLLLLTLILGTSLALAQNITVKGTVLDDLGDPLIGASVSQKGTTNGTMTDADGRYTLSVPGNATLVVSFVGFVNQEIAVGSRATIDVKLVEDSRLLDEVVVTALGIKKEAKALGYAVSEVKGDDLTRGRDGNAITALSGRMAGVDISTGAGGPSGSTKVQIRGVSKLSGSNEPLYIIDGVPMDNSALSTAGMTGGYDLGNGISAISPSDIESVSVLKGASAAALYGSRASNGVVLITTKSGKGKESLEVDFSTNFNAVKVLSYLDDYQRVYGQGTGGRPPLETSHARTSTQSAWGAKLDPNQEYYIYNGEKRPYGNVNNNILDFFRTGTTFTNNLGVSGSTATTNFRASVSDMRNTDIVPSSDMYRTTFMFRGSVKVHNKVTVEGRANYTKEGVNNRPALSDSPNNVGNSIIGIAPSFDQKWLGNGYKDELGRYNSWNANEWRLNPYWVINEMQNKSHKDRMMGHMQINYEILPFLTVQGRAGTDWSRFKFRDFFPKYTDGRTAGEMTQTELNIQETNYEGLIMYNQKFLGGALDVSALLGGNIMKFQNEKTENFGKGENLAGVISINNYLNYETPRVHDIRKQVNSVFGSVGLGYKNFLYLDATIRNDVSSALAKENNSYTYPSVSGSFIFSEVVDLKAYKLSFGKIRASWAKVGGDTDPYRLYNTYGLLGFSIGGFPLGQLSSTDRMANYNLKPESKCSYEFGADLRFFEDRLGIDFNYFNESTKDQIINLRISPTSGYKTAMINAGELTSTGIEIALNAIPVKTTDFDWSISVNMSTVNNKVKSLIEGMDHYETSRATWAGASIVAKVGERFGSIMGKKFARTDEGQVIYNDKGMPTYENNISVLGNGNYDVNMGINNSFRYKDFALGILLDMKFGGDIYSMSMRNSYYNGTSEGTLGGRDGWYASEEARRAANATVAQWTATGGYVGKGVVPIMGADGKPTGEYRENTTPVDPQEYWRIVADNTPEPFIRDASYIKLRELTFSYTLPRKLLTNTPIKSLSFTAYGRNLWVLHSNLKNIDPESSYNSSNAQGFEYGSIPSRRTFGFGVNVKF